GHGLLGRNLRDENSHPSETEVEARPAVRLHRANDLGAEHVLVPAGGRLRIRAAQMDVVIREGGHVFLPLIGQLATLGRSRCPYQPDPTPRIGSHAIGGLSAGKRNSYNGALCRRKARSSATKGEGWMRWVVFLALGAMLAASTSAAAATQCDRLLARLANQVAGPICNESADLTTNNPATTPPDNSLPALPG